MMLLCKYYDSAVLTIDNINTAMIQIYTSNNFSLRHIIIVSIITLISKIFQSVFRMTRGDFYTLPHWKRCEIKRRHNLY